MHEKDLVRLIGILVGYYCIISIQIIRVECQYNYVVPPTHPTAAPPRAPLPPIKFLEGDPGCIGEGFFSNPNDCSKFFRCASNGAYYKRYDFDCAAGTVFDPTISVCNFPGRGGTLQDCERHQVIVEIQRIPPPREQRPPSPRRPIVVVIDQNYNAKVDEIIEPTPNPGNYGQRDRRPVSQARRPLNPNRNNVRIWTSRNNYEDYE